LGNSDRANADNENEQITISNINHAILFMLTLLSVG